jgi:hypothetical protein
MVHFYRFSTLWPRLGVLAQPLMQNRPRTFRGHQFQPRLDEIVPVDVFEEEFAPPLATVHHLTPRQTLTLQESEQPWIKLAARF